MKIFILSFALLCMSFNIQAQRSEPSKKTSTLNFKLPKQKEDIKFKLKLKPFDTDFFYNYVNQRLTEGPNKVVGYQLAVVKKDKLVMAKAGGYADLQHKIKMSPGHDANIGSTQKFLTSALFLRLVDQKVKKEGHSNRDKYLNKKLYHFFPKAFNIKGHTSLAKLSFYDLLSHTSNFDSNSDLPSEYLVKGINTPEQIKKTRTYQNANFSLLGYLIPTFHSPAIIKAIDALCNLDVKCARKILGKQFEILMKSQLLAKVSPNKISGHCKGILPISKGTTTAKNYATPAEPKFGLTYNEYNRLGHCHGAGGWHFSARDLAAVLINLESNNDFMTSSFYKSWVNPKNTTEYDNRFVWFWSNSSNYIKTTFGWNRIPTQGGDHGFYNGLEGHAAILKLPMDYYAIGIVNSTNNAKDMNAGKLGAIMQKGMILTFKKMLGN